MQHPVIGINKRHGDDQHRFHGVIGTPEFGPHTAAIRTGNRH